MVDLIIHDFNDHPVRSFQREDGEFCFVAKDICTCLEIKNNRDALSSLDDDEAGVVLTDTRSNNGVQQKRDLRYVTESGLYTIILRSRKAVTPGTVQHRFRKWVTGEVLPALRKTGAYAPTGMDIIAVPVGGDRALLNNEINARTAILREARNIYGREAAATLWKRLGLPDIASEGVNELAGTAKDDGVGCLNHLLNHSAGNGLSVRQVLSNGQHDKRSSAGHRFGISVNNQRIHPGGIAIVNQHPFLETVFAQTQWAGNWREALLSLDGARSGRNPISIGKKKIRYVFVPYRHIDWSQ